MISWEIAQMDCYPSTKGQTDVVFTVHWRCNGEQVADGKTYTSTAYGSVGVTYVAGSTFTPYTDLTKDQVLGWVWSSGVNKSETEASITKQLSTQINPIVVSPALPWSN